MDTWEYELEYDDRTHDLYFSYVIAEKLFLQVDSERHQFLILEGISDHWSDGMAIDVADGFIISRGGRKQQNKMTHGWELITQTK